MRIKVCPEDYKSVYCWKDNNFHDWRCPVIKKGEKVYIKPRRFAAFIKQKRRDSCLSLWEKSAAVVTGWPVLPDHQCY